MGKENQRLVRFVEKMDFNELEDGQMFAMVDWKLAIINPTEDDWRDYYYDQRAERQMEEKRLAEHNN